MRDWVRERIGSLKTPEMIVIVDEVPQTATGKILRRQVQASTSAADPLRRLRFSARSCPPPGCAATSFSHLVEPLGVALERAVEEVDRGRG